LQNHFAIAVEEGGSVNVDDEHGSIRPVEETPGYVGHIFDDYYTFQDELEFR